MTRQYELIPIDNRKSFYGKAFVVIDTDKDTETLYSYNTPIIRKDCNGNLTRLYDGWTATTGRHIAAYCGLNKKEFMAIKVES